MTLVQQTAWPWIIAAYLFLGGLGGGVMALGAYTDLLLQKNDKQADHRVGLYAAIVGEVALGLGSLLLLYDLEQPLKAYLVVRNLNSWIAWGTMFITIYMMLTAIYGLPYLFKVKVGALWQRAAGFGAGFFGLLVAVYTGFLLASSTGVPFWNPNILPIVFVVSGFSAGAAALMLYLSFLKDSPFAKTLLHRLEKWDIGLILFEVVALVVLFVVGATGHPAAQASAKFLLTSAGFLVGVPLAGLLIPLGLEWYGLKKHAPRLSVVAGILVLTGGALLRLFLLQAGYWGLPRL